MGERQKRAVIGSKHIVIMCGALAALLCLFFVASGCLRIYRTYLIHQAIAECNGSEACFSSLILDAVRDGSLEDGFKLLDSIYTDTPLFRPDCHNFSLRLTKVLYERYPNYMQVPLAPAIVTCNYGFLQQYPTVLLLDTKDVGSAQKFCDRVAHSIGNTVPGAEAECYRGIGRGLPFVDSAAQGDPVRMATFAIQACKDLTSDPSNYGTCLSGLFNMIGRTEVAHGSGLSIDASDPMRLCKLQSDPVVRDHCFGNFKATVVSMVDVNDPVSAEREILRLYGTNSSTTPDGAIWTIGYEWGRTKLVTGTSPAPAIAACAALSPAFMHECIQGISVGIAKHGVPFAQHVLMTAFCKAARSSLPALVSTDCPSQQAVGYIRGIYSRQAYRSAHDFMQRELGSVAALNDDTAYGY